MLFHILFIFQAINLALATTSEPSSDQRSLPEKLLFDQPLEQYNHAFQPPASSSTHPSALDTFSFLRSKFLGCYPSSEEGLYILDSVPSSHKNEKSTRVDSCLAFCSGKRKRHTVAGVGFQKGCWCLEMMPEDIIDRECDLACRPSGNDEDMKEVCGGRGVLAVLS